MATYTQLKTAVKAALETQFAGLGVTPALVSFSDLDSVLREMKTTNAVYGIHLEFAGAGRQKRESFASREWQWNIVGVILIAYKGELGDLEAQLTSALDQLRTLFKGSETLGGVTSFASIDAVESADPITLADMPFYWLPFTMSFVDKL